RHAILTGDIDVRVGLGQLPAKRRAVWLERIEEAEESTPEMFRRNGWVVGAFQASWAAISSVSPIPEGKFAQREALGTALRAAVRAGYDTDTIACITGALMGAALGPKAVLPEWRRMLFGWPSYGVAELEGLVERVIAPMVDGGGEGSAARRASPGACGSSAGTSGSCAATSPRSSRPSRTCNRMCSWSRRRRASCCRRRGCDGSLAASADGCCWAVPAGGAWRSSRPRRSPS